LKIAQNLTLKKSSPLMVDRSGFHQDVMGIRVTIIAMGDGHIPIFSGLATQGLLWITINLQT